MRTRPKIKLSRLRDIGWSEWDPIGLLDAGEVWDLQPFADEYDSYLMKAAGDLRRGATLRDAVDYLLHIEREYMGLGRQTGQEARAERTVRALQRYMAELDGQHSNPASAPAQSPPSS